MAGRGAQQGGKASSLRDEKQGDHRIMIQSLFDYEAGQAERDAGFDRASNPFYRRELLEWARLAARRVAEASGSVCYDDVYQVLEEMGKQPELLGNAAGLVFRGAEWEPVGWKQSERKTNHARAMRMWKLREP